MKLVTPAAATSSVNATEAMRNRRGMAVEHWSTAAPTQKPRLVPLDPECASQRRYGMPTCRVLGTGGVASGGALGEMLGWVHLKKVHFPVAMAMIKCAKNTIEIVWWEIDESLFFSPC